jgi:hypothetical protein
MSHLQRLLPLPILVGFCLSVLFGPLCNIHIHASAGTSSHSSSLGTCRASGPNPFTRGPSSGSAALSCHEVGELLLPSSAVVSNSNYL